MKIAASDNRKRGIAMSYRFPYVVVSLMAAGCFCAAFHAQAEERSTQGENPAPAKNKVSIVGRWDLTIHGPEGDYPSWLDVQKSGYHTIVGYFVGQIGSVRPLTRVEVADGRLRFTVPPQWEPWKEDHVFDGKLEGDVLRGKTTDDKGRPVRWEGRRAPSLKRAGLPTWGEPVELFNGRDLTGWKPRLAKVKNGWKVHEGLLANVDPGNDLLTEKKFTDFKLHAEFRYPSGSNSGIHLRGRYEVQIEDNFGDEPESHKIGGVYGFLTPRIIAARPAGQWQTMDITLVGRVVTVVFNGELVIDRQTISGITGGALDSDEGQPGPIMLQGDHGPIEFRKVTLWPARNIQ
jgi:hypothetical protein